MKNEISLEEYIEIFLRKIGRLKFSRNQEQSAVIRQVRTLEKIAHGEIVADDAELELLSNKCNSIRALANYRLANYIKEINKVNAVICLLREIKRGNSKKCHTTVIEDYIKDNS